MLYYTSRIVLEIFLHYFSTGKKAIIYLINITVFSSFRPFLARGRKFENSDIYFIDLRFNFDV